MHLYICSIFINPQPIYKSAKDLHYTSNRCVYLSPCLQICNL